MVSNFDVRRDAGEGDSLTGEAGGGGLLQKNWVGKCRPGFQKRVSGTDFFGLQLGSPE